MRVEVETIFTAIVCHCHTGSEDVLVSTQLFCFWLDHDGGGAEGRLRRRLLGVLGGVRRRC